MIIKDYQLHLPKGWYRWSGDPSAPLDAAAVEATRAEVAEWVAADPDLAPHQEALVKLLTGFWEDAIGKGAIGAAQLWEPTPGGPTVANVMVFLAEREADQTVDDLLARFSRPARDDQRPRQATVVKLPAGPAVRVQRLTEVTDETDDAGAASHGLHFWKRRHHSDAVALEAVQYWICPEWTTDVLLLSASTPCLAAADALAEVFDQIAGSVELTSG